MAPRGSMVVSAIHWLSSVTCSVFLFPFVITSTDLGCLPSGMA